MRQIHAVFPLIAARRGRAVVRHRPGKRYGLPRNAAGRRTGDRRRQPHVGNRHADLLRIHAGFGGLAVVAVGNDEQIHRARRGRGRNSGVGGVRIRAAVARQGIRRAVVLIAGEQGGRTVQHRLARQVDGIGPGAAGCVRACVPDRPAQRRGTADDQGRRRHALRGQGHVGKREVDRCRSAVVGQVRFRLGTGTSATGRGVGGHGSVRQGDADNASGRGSVGKHEEVIGAGGRNVGNGDGLGVRVTGAAVEGARDRIRVRAQAPVTGRVVEVQRGRIGEVDRVVPGTDGIGRGFICDCPGNHVGFAVAANHRGRGAVNLHCQVGSGNGERLHHHVVDQFVDLALFVFAIGDNEEIVASRRHARQRNPDGARVAAAGGEAARSHDSVGIFRVAVVGVARHLQGERGGCRRIEVGRTRNEHRVFPTGVGRDTAVVGHRPGQVEGLAQNGRGGRIVKGHREVGRHQRDRRRRRGDRPAVRHRLGVSGIGHHVQIAIPRLCVGQGKLFALIVTRSARQRACQRRRERRHKLRRVVENRTARNIDVIRPRDHRGHGTRVLHRPGERDGIAEGDGGGWRRKGGDGQGRLAQGNGG